jgi:hypothetical protein
MNSAPTSTISPAPLKKARISHSTECTGLRAVITHNRGQHHERGEQVEGDGLDHACARRLAIGRIGFKVRGDSPLPLVPLASSFALS